MKIVCAFAALSLAAIGCSKDNTAPVGADSGSVAAAVAVASASSLAAAASAKPGGSASAGVNASANAAAGAWSGTYKSTKGTITVPDGIKWQGDDGTAGIGDGTITMSISPSGIVTGTASGALGDLVISGIDRGGEFSASLHPSAKDGFTGTFLGAEPAAGATSLDGTMRLSDGENRLVRTATVHLSKT